jgi:hypothetical protein
MNGADIHTVALIPGHKDLRMAARYQHLSPAFLSDAVKLLDSASAEKALEASCSCTTPPLWRVRIRGCPTNRLPVPNPGTFPRISFLKRNSGDATGSCLVQ